MLALAYRLLQQRQRVVDAPGEAIGRAQGGRDEREEDRDVRHAAHDQAALQDRDGALRVATHDVERSQAPGRQSPAVGVVRGLGDGDSLLPAGDALGEIAELGQAPGEPGPGVHRGQPRHLELLSLEVALERRNGTPKEVGRARIVPERVMDLAQAEVRHDAQVEFLNPAAMAKSR